MFTGESIIFKYAVNDKLAGITAFHQVGVVSSERFVIPRHVRIPLHLVHVKLCPEEAAQAFIVVQRSLINLCLTEIFQEEIDISQLSPAHPPVIVDGDGFPIIMFLISVDPVVAALSVEWSPT